MKLLLSFLIIIFSLTVHSKILHTERSLYRNILVEELDWKRCMVFGRRSKHPDYQSCINMSEPNYLVFSYTKLVLAGLSILPKPKSILIIGLGGGTIPLSLEKLYPDSRIDTVEIDKSVVNVAKKWFFYKESINQKTYVLDGRVFVKRQLRNEKNYDLIILDAFNGDYIPEHLMTKEFLFEIKKLLSSEGLLIANTFSNNQLYNHESVTYNEAFDSFNYIHSKKSGNRVIFATKNNTRKFDFLAHDSKLAIELMSIGVNLEDFEQRLTNKPDWDNSARLLTDQYSPANLLNK